MRMSRHLGIVNSIKMAANTTVTFGSLNFVDEGSGTTWNVPHVGHPSGYKRRYCWLTITVSGRPAKITRMNFSGKKYSVANGTYNVRICPNSSNYYGQTAVAGGSASVAFTDYNGNVTTANAAGLLRATWSNCILPVGTYKMWIWNSDTKYHYFGDSSYNFKIMNQTIENG